MSQDSQSPPPRHTRADSADGVHQRIKWLLRAAAAKDILVVAPSQAAVAQRAVWELNNLGSEALAEWVEADIGGGIRLTPRGRRLSVAVGVAREAEARLIAQFGAGLADDLKLLDRVRVRTSARNQFLAQIQSLNGGTLYDEAVLILRGGRRVSACLTRDSADALGLVPGSRVVALIKATSMGILPGGPASRDLFGVNRLSGHVVSLRRDGTHAEVQVDLGDGLTAVALRPAGELKGIAVDETVRVFFDPAAIIFGVIA